MLIITIIVFVLLFGVIVFVHELGHFLAAKRAGVGVEEFAFGFPPRLISWKRGETTYAINAVPLGGYVRLLGEDQDSKDPRSFTKQSHAWQAVIVIAGVVMNALLAWIILTFLLVLPNSYKTVDALLVAQVQPGSAAEKVGIKVGDLLDTVNDTHLKDPAQLRDITHSNAGKEVTVVIRRNGREQVKQVALGQGDTPLGVGTSSFSLADLPHPSIWAAPFVALKMVGQVAVANFTFIGALISGLLGFGPHASTDQVAGPIGIYGVIAQFTALGWPYVLMGAAELSLAIALFNILPIPALDGGRLLFILLAKFFRRRLVSHQVEGVVHTIGFALLIGLFVLVTWNDIVKLTR